MGNCHSVGEQRSVPTQTLGAIPVFKPLTGQCTGMAPICIKRDLSHDGVWCGRRGGGGGRGRVWAIVKKKIQRASPKKKFQINSNKKVDKGTRLA